MKGYVSITRSFRGFSYQNNWNQTEDWKAYLKAEKENNNEIEWSILINLHGGIPVLRYNRGGGVKLLKIENV